ncbi:MAG: DUF1444 family protein [Acidimicrobiales bacterium]|nr:DUF1444 family protein [Acidimicrobiales bacterium]
MALFGRKTPKSFDGLALASCRRLRPEISWKLDRDRDLMTGAEIDIELTSLRAQFDDIDPDERAAWVEGHLSDLVYRMEPAGDPGPDDPSIRALIRPRILVEQSRLRALIDGTSLLDGPIFSQLSHDLVGVVGIDEPTSIQLVSGTSMREWETSFETLWETGVNSLLQLPTTEWSSVNQNVFVSGTQDDYTNSRLLCPDHLAPLNLTEPAVVLLPHRNALIVAALSDADAITLACDLALQELDAPSPISTRPFVFEDGIFTPLLVAAEHPAYVKVAMLRLIDDDRNHKATAALLAEQQPDFIIGGFFVDQSRLVSSTNWGPGITLVPCVDEIVFIDHPTQPAKGMVAPWDQAFEHLGSAMTPTDHYPMRFRVEELPDPDIIRSISRPLPALPPF